MSDPSIPTCTLLNSHFHVTDALASHPLVAIERDAVPTPTGLIALTNQKLGKPAGYLNPLLYSIVYTS